MLNTLFYMKNHEIVMADVISESCYHLQQALRRSATNPCKTEPVTANCTVLGSLLQAVSIWCTRHMRHIQQYHKHRLCGSQAVRPRAQQHTQSTTY